MILRLNGIYSWHFRLMAPNITEQGLALFFSEPSRGRNFVTWLNKNTSMGEVNHHLLEIFCKNISLCAQNVGLIELLKDQAYRDPLLDIPNLAMLHEHLKGIRKCNTKDQCTIVLLDIDQFSQLNDYFGHAYGDGVLKALNRFLHLRFDPAIFIARTGADIFCLVGPADLLESGKFDLLTEITLEIDNVKRDTHLLYRLCPASP